MYTMSERKNVPEKRKIRFTESRSLERRYVLTYQVSVNFQPYLWLSVSHGTGSLLSRVVVLPMKAYTGRLRPGRVPFQASG